MYTLQIRNLPENLYLELKAAAKASKRSMTQEAIHAIETFINNNRTKELERERKANLFGELVELNRNTPLNPIPEEWFDEDLK